MGSGQKTNARSRRAFSTSIGTLSACQASLNSAYKERSESSASFGKLVTCQESNAPLSTARPPRSRSTSFQKTVLNGPSFFGRIGRTSPRSMSSSRTCCEPLHDSLSDRTATPPLLSLAALIADSNCAGVLMLWSA